MRLNAVGAPTYPSPSAGLWANKEYLGSVTNILVGASTHQPACSELDPFSEFIGRREKPTVPHEGLTGLSQNV